MAAPAAGHEYLGHGAAIEAKDLNIPGNTNYVGGRLAATPFKRSRLGLHIAAVVLALGTIVAQAILMADKKRWADYVDSDYVEALEYWLGDLGDVRVKGKVYAKEPTLVIAAGVVALVLAVVLLVAVCLPIVSASLWGAILEVCLVPALPFLWLAAVAVSAKTANVMNKTSTGGVSYRWPKLWVACNWIALALECISVGVWIATLVLSILSLMRVARAFRARRAQRKAQQQVAGGGVALSPYSQRSGVYAV